MPKSVAIYGLSVLFILSFFFFCFAQEQITITTYYPSPFGSYREITWGDLPNRSRGILTDDQGSSIELGGLNNAGGPAIPFIDFHNDMVPFPAGDFDIRIGMVNDNRLRIEGVTVATYDGRTAPGSIPVGAAGAQGIAHLPGCIYYSYTATSGVTNCPAGYRAPLTSSVASTGSFLCCQYQ